MFNSTPNRLTPRRNPVKARESLAPLSRAQSVFSENQAAPTPRSRLAVVRGPPSPAPSTIAETVRTVREIDGFERITWSKDAHHEVYSAGSLPKDVQRIVKASDFMDDIVAGHVDPISGFAFVATPRQCIAWNYQKRTHSSPTCYYFQAPEAQYGLGRLPVLASLFTSANAAEPGMVLVGPSGEMRFWESMSLALANAGRYQAVQLELAEDDYADRIHRIDGQNFIVTTTSCFAYRVTVTLSAGRVVAHYQQLMRSGGFLARASPVLFQRREEGDRITGVAVSDGAVFILSGGTLQKWNMSGDGQKLVQEYNLPDLFQRAYPDQSSDLAFRDLVPCGHDKLAALVSYSQSQSSSSAQGDDITYGVHLFSIDSYNTFRTSEQDLRELSHASSSDHRYLDTPKLHVPASSPTAFVRFTTEVVAVSLEEGVDHEDVIRLKETSKNAFFGVGCVSTPTTNRRTAAPALLLMPVTGGLLSVDMIDAPMEAYARTATGLVQSKIEQHVFFGDRNDNPLSFSIGPDQIDGADIEAAAEAVSADILSCKSPYQPAIFETKALLADRLARLREIMAFIRTNGLLNKVGQASRRRLSRDAEKAKGAVELWDHQDHQMAHIHSDSSASLLADSIEAYMRQAGSSRGDDVIRSFFRLQIANLDRLLDVTFATFKAKTAGLSQQAICPWVKEANIVFNIVTRAASRYREEEIRVYEIDRERPTVALWTAKESIMQAMETLYDITERTINDRTKMLGSTIDEASADARDNDLKQQRRDQNVLKTQLSDLAAGLCLNMEDKIRLHSQREMNGGADANEGIVLKKRWDELRPKVIRPLVNVDRVDQAYDLAEHHNDFATLVWLCHEPASERGQERVQHYIELFQEEFAFVLYRSYIEQNQLHALMTQDEVYGKLLTKFFETHDHPQLAWMHDIACKRYGAAAKALVSVDKRSGSLSEKQLVSSIGKLAAVAEIKSTGGVGSFRKTLNDIDDNLDLVRYQNDLRDSIASAGKDSLDAYIEANGNILAGRPELRALFHNSATRLLQGEALKIEDLVDVLTLKDNRGVSVGDPEIALERLVHDTTLPEGRKQVALVSTWRRVYIRDDWHLVSNTAGRSDEAQREVLRNTLTYRTLKSITNDPRFPSSFIISPYDALTPPYDSELSARFPGRPADKIDALMRDHEGEISLLGDYLDKAGLEGMVRECAELIRRDEAEMGGMDGEGDVDEAVDEDEEM